MLSVVDRIQTGPRVGYKKNVQELKSGPVQTVYFFSGLSGPIGFFLIRLVAKLMSKATTNPEFRFTVSLRVPGVILAVPPRITSVGSK